MLSINELEATKLRIEYGKLLQKSQHNLCKLFRRLLGLMA